MQISRNDHNKPNRGSEVEVVIRNTTIVRSEIINEFYRAHKFLLELRKRLKKEDMGCVVVLVDNVERKFHKLSQMATLNCKY